jgi:hypothetical protein
LSEAGTERSEEADTERSEQAGQRPIDRLRKRGARVFAGIAALVGVLVGVTSLVDWLQEEVDDPPPRPPPAVDARVTALTLRDTRLPLAEYLTSTGQSTKGLTRREANEPGYVFSVRVRLKGGIESDFPLLWTLHRAKTGERLKGVLYNQPASVTFRPLARDHARTWPIWVPYPPRPGAYFLRVTLTDEKRQPVDERQSRPFEVTNTVSSERQH